MSQGQGVWVFDEDGGAAVGVTGTGELERVCNINHAARDQFQVHYGDPDIDCDALFYYTYGVLHSQQYRETFAADLQHSLPRIPMATTVEDFWHFASAGRYLSDIHTHYESVDPYPLVETWEPDWELSTEDIYKVTKMRWGGTRKEPDKSVIIYNAGITLSGIPAKVHEYMLGSRSALEWVMNGYQIKIDKASGIVNDPNDWCKETGDPRYILDLLKRITAVSIDTVNIVAGLPRFQF